MSHVDVRDMRNENQLKYAGIAGVATLGILAVLEANIIACVIAGVTVGVLVRGRTVDTHGMDKTVVYRAHRRPAEFMWIITGGAVAAFFFDLLAGSTNTKILLGLFAVGCAVTALAKGHGDIPFVRTRATAPVDASPEERAARSVGDHIFHQTGMFTKSAETGIEIYPEIIRVAFDEKNRPFFEFRVMSGRQTVEDVQSKAGYIASAWDVPRVRITEPVRHVARVTALFRDSEASDNVKWKPRPAAPVVEYCSALPMGVDIIEGDPWTLDIRQKHFVIAGVTGSGKSSFANGILAHLALHRDVRIAYLDLKYGAEAAPWKDRADQVMCNLSRKRDPEERSIEDMIEFIDAAMSDVGERYERMIDAGVRDAWQDGFLGKDEPVKVLVVDECSRIFRKDTKERLARSERAEAALQEFIEQGRAAGYILIIMTQYPTSVNLPTTIRVNASGKIAFRMDMHGMYATLGGNYSPRSEEFDPTEIPEGSPGRAVLVDKKGNQRVLQMVYLDGDTQQRVVAESARWRTGRWLDDGNSAVTSVNRPPALVEEPPRIEPEAPESAEPPATQTDTGEVFFDPHLDIVYGPDGEVGVLDPQRRAPRKSPESETPPKKKPDDGDGDGGNKSQPRDPWTV